MIHIEQFKGTIYEKVFDKTQTKGEMTNERK